MYILLILLLMVIFFKNEIDNTAKSYYIGRTHIVRERHHVATDYRDSLLNTKEGFLRICSRHGIKVKQTYLSPNESVEQIVFSKGMHKAEQISVSLPYTKEKFYLLSGFIMKSFCIPKETMLEDGFVMSTSLYGFEASEYNKVIESCDTNDISDICKELILE